MRTSTITGYALALLMATSGAAFGQSASPWPDSRPAAQTPPPAAAKPPTAPTASAPKKPAAPKSATVAKPTKPKTAAKTAATAAKPKAKTAAKPAVAAPPPAFSPTPEQLAGINFTCSRDSRDLCKDASAGSPEVYACLQRNSAKLSSDCRTSVMAVEESAAEDVDPDATPAAAAPKPAAPPKRR
jgi:hypothetical protein